MEIFGFLILAGNDLFALAVDIAVPQPLDENAGQTAAERICLVVFERHDELPVRGDITPAGVIEILGIDAETHHRGAHLAELAGIVPLGGKHFTPFGVDIPAARLHPLKIHAVKVGIERRQTVVELPDAFIAERTDFIAVAVHKSVIDIVVAHHGDTARKGLRHGETGRNRHIALYVHIAEIAELFEHKGRKSFARRIEVVVPARNRLAAQRVDQSPLPAVRLVAQHHAASVVGPGIAVLEIGNVGEEAGKHFAAVGVQEAVLAAARHGNQPVCVRLADQIVVARHDHFAVFAQIAPLAVAQHAHPAPLVRLADFGVQAGNNHLPRLIDAAPKLARGLHPRHAVLKRFGKHELRSDHEPSHGVDISPSSFGDLYRGQSVGKSAGVGIAAFDRQPPRSIDIAPAAYALVDIEHGRAVVAHLPHFGIFGRTFFERPAARDERYDCKKK